MPPHSNFLAPPFPISSSLPIEVQEEETCVRPQPRLVRARTHPMSKTSNAATACATTNHTNFPAEAPPPSPGPQPPNLTKNDQEHLGKVCFHLQQKYGSRTSRLVHAAKLHDKGIQFIEEGNAHKAITLLRQSFQIRSCIYGLYHEDIAASLYNLGRVYHDREDYTTALHLYNRVLDIQKRILKKGHVGIITTITNIARVHHLKGDLDQALAMNKELLRVTIEKVGKKHPFVASIYRTLGTILLEMKQMDFAMKAFVIASRITKATDDDDLAASTALTMSRTCQRPADAAAA